MPSSLVTQVISFLKKETERLGYLFERRLIYQGKKLLREKFDSIHKPEDLELTLNDPAIKRQLLGGVTDQERHCLYPPDPAKHVSSADFNLELILKLFRIIGGPTLPAIGQCALLHGGHFEEDLARIEYYCTSYMYDRTMTDDRFGYLWGELSEAFLRIAASISSEKRREWEIFIHELKQDLFERLHRVGK